MTEAYSANIDGVREGYEWDDAIINMLIDGESNCGINFALVQTKIDSENNALFLCFMHKDPMLESDNVITGVEFTVDDSDCFLVTPECSPAYVDSDEHSLEGAALVNEDNGATTEIRVGFKAGLPKEIRCEVRFIDSTGAYSNFCSFTVVNDEYSETTEMIITLTEPETTEKETAPKKEKTTKPKKQTTARQTKKTTVKETRKTTEKTKKNNDSPRKDTYEITLRPPKTKKQSTTVTETQKQTQPPATVYYYEKEVIVSHIYVTQTETSTTTVTTTENVTTNGPKSTLATPLEPETEIRSSYSLSEGTKKKLLVGVLAAISFTVIAAAGTRSAKKNKDNNDNPDSQ